MWRTSPAQYAGVVNSQRKVILYGDSLILEGIRANLSGGSNLEIVSLAPPLPKAQELGALAPDVIIFDLEASRLDALLSLLQIRPQLLLVGVDLATNQILLWSSEHSRRLTMHDLVGAIHGEPDSAAAQQNKASDLERRGTWFTQRLNDFRVLSRRRRLALAAAAVGLCVILAGTLALIRPIKNTSLVGAVVGGQSALGPILAFTAGIVLGGVLIGWWLRRGLRSDKKAAGFKTREEAKKRTNKQIMNLCSETKNLFNQK